MRKQYVNAKRNNRTFQHRGYKWLLFILVLLLLSGVLLLRYLHTDRQRREALVFPSGIPAMDIVEESTPTEQTVTVPADSVQGTSSLTVTEDQAATPEAEVNSTGFSASESSAAATNSEPGKGKSTYNEQTYQLVTDIVHLIRNQGTEAENRIRSLVAELKASDPDLGALWERITDYWFYAASDFTVNPGKLPDGLPQDDSLGIVVLGFQLLYDGHDVNGLLLGVECLNGLIDELVAMIVKAFRLEQLCHKAVRILFHYECTQHSHFHVKALRLLVSVLVNLWHLDNLRRAGASSSFRFCHILSLVRFFYDHAKLRKII